MKIFAFKEEKLKEKTQDANFSLPNKNPESAIKNGFRIRIPKLAENWADSGSGFPSLHARYGYNIVNLQCSPCFL